MYLVFCERAPQKKFSPPLIHINKFVRTEQHLTILVPRVCYRRSVGRRRSNGGQAHFRLLGGRRASVKQLVKPFDFSAVVCLRFPGQTLCERFHLRLNERVIKED